MSSNIFEEKCRELIQLIDEKNQEIERLKMQSKAENRPIESLQLFQEFLMEATKKNLIMKRKYNTKITREFVDINYADFWAFINVKLEKEEILRFKDYLSEMELVDAETFSKKVVAIDGEKKVRVVRVKIGVYKQLIQGLE